VSILVFHPRRHYPAWYGTTLTPHERAMAFAYDTLVTLWRRRSDAHCVLTPDEGAVAYWARRRGAPVAWFPEPPVLDVPPAAKTRSGVVLYGSMSRRKGVDRLASALRLARFGGTVTLAGDVEAQYAPEFELQVEKIRSAVGQVECRGQVHDAAEGLSVLAGAQCAVIPYRNHWGMSRVVLESAAVGTPVIAPDHGLLGHLVRTFDLGLAVPVEDPHALARAIDRLTIGGESASVGRLGMERLVQRHSLKALEAAVRAASPNGWRDEATA
jgi:glycosyltransferase involved in cell wall biosynthesis